jgi:hypothetical protein
LLGIFDINTISLENGRISFNDMRNNSTILFDELGGPIADIPKPLNSKRFPFNSQCVIACFVNK